MPIKTNTTIEVEIEGIDIPVETSGDITSSGTISIIPDSNENTVDVIKNEYSIVGDDIYASVSAEEAPIWLTTIIQDVVTTQIADGFTDYDTLVQNVQDAISAIDIAENTYVKQIDISSIVDGIVATEFESINATFGTTYATKAEVTQVQATLTDAIALEVTDLVAAISTEVSARNTAISIATANEALVTAANLVNLQSTLDGNIASINTTLSTQVTINSVLSESIDTFEAVLDDQALGLSGYATTLQGVTSYVGLEDDGTPTPIASGLLANVATLQAQSDGTIEYFINTYDVINDSGTPDPSDDSLILTAEPYLTWIGIDTTNGNNDERDAHLNDIYIRYTDNAGAKEYDRAYRFVRIDPADTTTDVDGYRWLPITTTVSENMYVSILEAQGAADGKISSFYAWYDFTTVDNAPASFTDGSITFNANDFIYWFKSDSNLYYKPDTTWVLVPTTPNSNVYISEGDLLTVFDKSIKDYKSYVYKSGVWTDVSGPGIVATSSAYTNLFADLGTRDSTLSGSTSLQNEVNVYAGVLSSSVESKFMYESNIIVDGNDYYTTGFGIKASGSGSGTSSDPYSSEFWITADQLRITSPSDPSNYAEFDTSGTTPILRATYTEATKGANWGTDIANQPSDTDLLNNNTVWSQVAGTTNAPADNATANPNAIDAGGAAADINTYTTLISGGKIQTGSITANQISLSTIPTASLSNTAGWTNDSTANSAYNLANSKLSPGSAAADINTYTTLISGGKIQTGSIAANHLTVDALDGKSAAFSGSRAYVNGGGWCLTAVGTNGASGIHSEGNIWGLVGRSYANDSTAVFGYSDAASTVGVRGKGETSGFWAESTANGFGYNSQANYVGYHASSGCTWSFYAYNQSYLYGTVYPFTAGHLGFTTDEMVVGDIVKVTFVKVIDISNSLTELAVTTTTKDSTVFGICSSKVDVNADPKFKTVILKQFYDDEGVILPEYAVYEENILSGDYTAILTNSIGEGAMNVCSENGDIFNGDYICSSSIAGKGMKQDDDILHNYTVAKALEDVDWSVETETTKMIACTYHCG